MSARRLNLGNRSSQSVAIVSSSSFSNAIAWTNELGQLKLSQSDPTDEIQWTALETGVFSA